MDKVTATRVIMLVAFLATQLMLPWFGGAGSTNCTKMSGNTSIPYPFGVEPGAATTPLVSISCTDFQAS